MIPTDKFPEQSKKRLGKREKQQLLKQLEIRNKPCTEVDQARE
jgi:hypothetical protein